MDPRPPSSPLRVLIRPPSAPSATSSSPSAATIVPAPATYAAATLPTPSSSSSSSSSSSAPPLPPKPSPPPPPPEGVVVVGFVGADAVHLINRILDTNAFGSGSLDTDFAASAAAVDRPNDWFRHHRVSYFHDSEKGVVFLHLAPSSLPSPGDGEGARDFDLRLEERECDDMRGMLFMFSVCHVIIFLHEGSRFETRLLQKFRLLQTAKSTLSPFIRSQFMSHTAQNRPSASLPQSTTGTAASRSPGRTNSGRHGSAVSAMSSPAPHPSAIPGHCVPVLLFVFLDEFPDSATSSSSAEDPVEAFVNQPSSSGVGRQNLSVKGTGPVVVLARPASKTEASFRKRLQSSLDSQIRFLIKKCRVLVGTEPGSRGSGNLASLPLFMLDASKAVVLLNKTANCRGKSLDFVTDLIDDILSSKAMSEALMMETTNSGSNIEDFQTIKDFIFRQCDSFRGRGSMPPSSGSSSGVGMVAAAAAAAAASTASGKPTSAPKLPNLENWVSSSRIVLQSLVSAKRQPLDEIGLTRRTPVRKSVSPVTSYGGSSTGENDIEAAVSCLESSRALNLRFSMSWCQRALPAAKEVYLRDLPPCYPTSLHKSQLEKSLHAFQLKVKGPAAQLFATKLEEECTHIWSSGRQLCDAISLTGKPCMHQRHNSCTGLPASEAKRHCSGYVFLHACACGRSRHLRGDPFDFESANLSFNCFPSCVSNLPAFELPKGILPKPLDASWSLVRLGGERYYDPAKGLLQIGFCGAEKYLLEWKIVVGQTKETTGTFICKESADSKTNLAETSLTEMENSKYTVPKRILAAGKENQENAASALASNIHFGKGFPLFVMKKAFSEVVAGTATVDRKSFLQLENPTSDGSEKGSTGMDSQNKNSNQKNHTSAALSDLGADNGSTGDPFLQIGSNVVPVNLHSSGELKTKSPLKEFSVYIGFEHECPRGHRFLLSKEHLSSLGSSYSSPASSSTSNDEADKSEFKSAKENGKHMHLGKTTIVSENNIRKKHSSSVSAQNLRQTGKGTLSSGSGEPEENHQLYRINDGGHASLLQRDLPVYMNCPHCKHYDGTNLTKEKVNFASTVSQLQRIFLVTPPFPVVLATCPVVQFDESHLRSSYANCSQHLQFNFGCRVILPPESFLTLRLPFVYGVQLQDGSLQPLNYTEQQPELTAWLVKGTALEIVSKDCNID